MSKTPEELTEDWKAGKLATNWYYLKLESGEIELQSNNIGGFIMSIDNNVVQVLAPVPSYDEYRAMQERIADDGKTIEELSERYRKTKENETRLLEYTGKLLDRLKDTENTVKSLFQKVIELSKSEKQ